LTEDDLEKLGVSLGHRKILLRAIDALRSQANGITAISNIGTNAISPLQHREAEFRQITVMFGDLVGSTQLSEKLDLERVTADPRFHTPDLGGKAKTADVTAGVIDAIHGAND
jgi:SAM domain (Sterile alpha motif)